MASAPARHGVLERLGGAAGGRRLGVVTGKRHHVRVEVVGVQMLDRLCDPAVRPCASGAGHGRQDRGSHEVVSEPETERTGLVDQPAGDRFLDGHQRLVLVEPAGGRHHGQARSRRRPRPPARGPARRRRTAGRGGGRRPRGRLRAPPAAGPATAWSSARRGRAETSPLSTRWRTSSRAKNGLPSVSARMRAARATPAGTAERVPGPGVEQAEHLGRRRARAGRCDRRRSCGGSRRAAR